uniref:tRNA-dihydrouridine(47) synthase [NAD(P)(+)] n=1 Tax=Hucho hucho TaxID=62062 RepID=A0A4W5N6B5_9TELE
MNGTDKGRAAIKTQFLTTKEKFHELLDSGGKGPNEDKASDDAGPKEKAEDSLEEPQEKKFKVDPDEQESTGKQDSKRMRGQNKSRPHMKPTSYDNRRLCPSIIQERETKCVYGDKCKFVHDVAEYMALKPADVGEHCYLYDTFGKCHYGLSCRFAQAHTSVDLKNLANEELVKAMEGKTPVRNSLDKDLQWRLRKKVVPFTVSDAYMKTIFKGGHKAGEGWKKAATAENGKARQVCHFSYTVAKFYISKLRHESEDLFGVQVEGCFPDTMTRCAELLNNKIDVDFVDINSGCPIDLVYKKGGGCGLMTRTNKFEQIIRGMNSVLDVPLTVKIRTGVQEKANIAHKLIPEMKKWGVSMITLHGRSREQRYTKSADWDYINTCSQLASPIPLFGNGDILSYYDAMKARETEVSGIMLARGALIKPWVFTEIKERRDWDISSSERLDVLRDFTHYGLEHWGSDTQGLEKTRNFLLEWLSFMCRYIPVGLLERVPQRINERPPYYMGRDYLESLMASQHVGDWIKISEMLLGPVPKNFNFLPKHKANAYK